MDVDCSSNSSSNENFVIRLKSIRDRFEEIQEIGQGTYGVVQKCKDKETGEIVAVKKVRNQKSNKLDFPQTTIREVRLLRELRHPNIIELKLVVQTEDPDEKLFLIFDYCEYDLYALLYTKALEIKQIKSIMKQFLIVLQYCAGQYVVHRDLKPANMFITKDNILKLGDFGLACKIKPDKGRYSKNIITLWYRPPEILLSNKQNYKTEVDIWSAGCILYEMVTGKPLFKDKNDNLSQLKKIWSICGPFPSCLKTEEYPQLFDEKKDPPFKLKDYIEQNFKDHPDFRGLIPLLLKMLNLIPDKRISAEKALNDQFFQEIDSSYQPSQLLRIQVKEIHQKDVSDSMTKKKSSQEHIDKLQPEKKIPPSSDV